MKILALLFLVGFASASFRDVLDDAADEILRDYVEVMENNPSLKHYMAFADEETEEEIKTELGKKINEHIDKILEHIKDAVDHGKKVKAEFYEKLQKLRETLNDLHLDIGTKAKQLLKEIQEKAKDYWQKLLEKLGLKDKEDKEVVYAKRAINLKDIFEKLKKVLLDKLDKEAIIQKVHDLFGKASELGDQILAILKEKGGKGKQKILDFINKFLEDKEKGTEKRSISELWEKVKDYFKKLNLEIKEKFLKFGEWVKEVGGKHIEAGKGKIENLKEIATEFVKHVKDLKKDIAVEALDYLRPYKDDLGNLWEKVKDAAKEVMNRKDD